MSKKKDKAEKPAAEKIAAAAPQAEEREMLAISKALADPRRVQVLRCIASCEGPSCTDLRERLSMNAATLSHHMKQLETAGLITTSRDGKFVKAEVRRKTWKNYLAYLKDLAA